jgi:hypothetical protein
MTSYRVSRRNQSSSSTTWLEGVFIRERKQHAAAYSVTCTTTNGLERKTFYSRRAFDCMYNTVAKIDANHFEHDSVWDFKFLYFRLNDNDRHK